MSRLKQASGSKKAWYKMHQAINKCATSAGSCGHDEPLQDNICAWASLRMNMQHENMVLCHMLSGMFLEGWQLPTCTGTMSDMTGCTWAWGLEAWEEARLKLSYPNLHLIELRSYLSALFSKNFFRATLGAKATMWAQGYIGSLKNLWGKIFS